MHIRTPTRATRRYQQQLLAPPNIVFPLLCPVREIDWIEGWHPIDVVSISGLAERDCVFTTPAEPASAIWYVTQHDPQQWFVEMLKVTPGVTACRIEIQLSPSINGCVADITYIHTSLGTAGDQFVEEFTEEFYRGFMEAWEARLNHYLATGKRLASKEN